VGLYNRANWVDKCAIAFVILNINYALASALDLAGLSTPPWLLLIYRASIFLVLYTQSL
jgi:hypothetical protein